MAVQLITAALLFLAAEIQILAQTPAQQPTAFGIVDNSFFIEEAFNQDAGTFQNIVTAFRQQGNALDLAFTQEWPIRSTQHQFSYSVPLVHAGGHTGVGDALVSYRYQLWTEAPGRPAFSPRVGLLLPTGNETNGAGAGSTGIQVNLPFSRQREAVYLHGNAGFTWHPADAAFTPHAGASAVWNLRPLFNLLVEGLVEFDEARTTTLSPGARGGWNLGEKQVVVGAAIPTTWTAGRRETGLFVYLSYELPFR